MSRPTAHADLPDYSRAGTTVVSVELSQLPPNAKLLRAVSDLLEGAKLSYLVVTNDHGTVNVRQPKSTEELDASLELLQKEWDGNQEKFYLWEENGVPTETGNWAIYNVLAWARKEFPDSDSDITWLVEAHKQAKIRDASK